MWSIDNQTPFAAERTFVRDKDGAEIWLVAVRATFNIQNDGQLHIAGEQEPVSVAPQYFGKPGASSMRCDSDLYRTKLGTDVLLNSSAYSSSSKSYIEASLRVSTAHECLIDKKLLVSGESRWQRYLGVLIPGTAAPWERIPIRYERSFGGATVPGGRSDLFEASRRNPVGVGTEEVAGVLLPSIRYADDPETGPGKRAWAAGFGSISCAWLPRAKLAGTYDDQWQKTRQPLVPEDFSDEYFYAAPPDQRVPSYLRGGERVELWNMNQTGYLCLEIPKFVIGLRTWIGGATQTHRAVLHTLLIEPDEARLILVWHSALPCHHTLYTLKRTMVYLKSLASAED